MSFIECARCKQRNVLYCRGLCKNCYQHRPVHKQGCKTCKRLRFDFDKFLSTGRKQYRLKGSACFFIDKNGRRWSKENIEDLITAFEEFKSFQDTTNYYFK